MVNTRPQDRQCERGRTMDSPLGNLSAARLMKLPTNKATRTRYVAMKGAMAIKSSPSKEDRASRQRRPILVLLENRYAIKLHPFGAAPPPFAKTPLIFPLACHV